MSTYNVINTRAPRLDAPAKATGQALYTDDLQFSNLLYGAILQSPLAHARIKNIDLSKARKLPGVKAVVTARDLEIIPYGVSPARYDETILAVDKVRYVGDEVAAVAAVDRETAQEAVELIKVDYEELPTVFDPFEAMAEGAPLIHEAYPRNLCGEVHQEFGDVEAAFAQCDLIHEHKFVNKRQDAAFMEPNNCVAVFDHQGFLTLYSSTQVPHYVQRTVAMVLKIPVGRVRVVKSYVGGGFGPKASASTMELVGCLLSMKTLRPVKMHFSREQVFLHSRGRHQFFHTFKTGVKKDGTLMALHNTCYLEGGAYSSFGIATVYYAGSLLGGPYKLPNMKYDGYRVYTNRPACGAQRGHGGVAARAGFEQQLDIIAEQLGIDPVEMRLQNIMETGDTTCNELNMSSLGMKECIEAIRNQSDWKLKKGKLPKGRGIGIACGFFVSGAGYPIYRSDTYHATVVIKLSEDGGTAQVLTGSAEIGQGSDTAFGMIAAEALGVRLEDVRVASGDTDYSVDLGAYSSRQTLMTGHATKEAGEDAKRQVLEVLSETLNVPLNEISVSNGLIHFEGITPKFDAIRVGYMKEHRGWADSPAEGPLTFKEAARLAYLKKGTIVGTGKYKPPKLGGSFKGAAVGTSPAYGCSAMMAEVSVDLETGEVTMEKITDAHDCGLAINRTQVEGQMEGSVSMGLGESLFEEVKFNEKGQILNASLGEYKIPTALDVPPITSLIIESGEPNGPYGAKEVGEGGIMPVIPAILNAIYDATGVRINEMPLTSERIWKALKEKK
ncbi:MAG: molybdopterin-dependent oxidoreductase [Deltaproteobacteria bacterium]|nr:molybdopterin-dependent oxidoreductase [Deltaproteobacteria bacterium]